MQKINSGVTAPKGFLAGGVHCGVKNKQYRKKGYCYHLQRKALHSSSGLYTE